MALEIVTIAARPDLRGGIFAPQLQQLWPTFMQQDRTARLYYASPQFDRYLDFAFAALEDGEVVGRAFSVPFRFGIEGRTELPDGGWDEVIRWAHQDHGAGRSPTTLSALEIMLLPRVRGRGYAEALIDAMKDTARRHGLDAVYAPVRPSLKYLKPRLPMAEYAAERRPDGLPSDPWLRTHERVGGAIVKVAPCSMVVVGTLAEWARWTGVTFAASGEAEIEGALAPVMVSREQNHAVYVEPNVWMRHKV